MNEIINTIYSLISGNINSPFGNLCEGIWNVFSCVNGNPDNNNFGVRLFLGLFFSVFLVVILQLRTKLIYDKKHFIALTGVLFLCFRFISMLIFEWGWQIGMYDDYILHFLSPPLEYFFGTVFFFCIAYYSLNIYNYYPGILKRILFSIPIILISFFIYSTITWKNFFYSNINNFPKYNECMVDWQNHLMITIISLYLILVAIFKYKKYNCFLSAFWTITFIAHFEKTILSYQAITIPEFSTIFFALEIWSIPLLTLHFINAYVLRKNEIPIERRASINFRDKKQHEICSDCVKVKGGAMKIAIIDDCETTLHILKYICKEENLEILLYRSPLVALKEIPLKHIDLLLCDYMMFDMDGLEVIKQLRSQDVNCKMILMSALDINTIKLECNKEHLDNISFIAKPFTSEDIKNLFK